MWGKRKKKTEERKRVRGGERQREEKNDAVSVDAL